MLTTADKALALECGAHISSRVWCAEEPTIAGGVMYTISYSEPTEGPWELVADYTKGRSTLVRKGMQ